MKAVLHLGTEKTGSSSIQKFLHLNRDNLLNQGVYFLRSSGDQNDRKLAVYSMLENEYDDYHREHQLTTLEEKRRFESRLEEDLANEIGSLPESVHTVVISSEHFHSRLKSSGNREKLKKLLDKFFSSYHLVAYLRPQVDVSASHYSTALKTKSTASLDQYLEGCNPYNYYYDYDKFLSGWEECFPESKMSVHVFDKKELEGGDVVFDICHLLGIGQDGFKKVGTVNESVQPTGQELLRVINSHMPAITGGVGKNRERQFFVQMISNMYAGSGQKPDLERAKDIQLKFDDINEKVKRRWFPDQKTLFDIDFGKYPVPVKVDWEVVRFFENFIEVYKKSDKGQLIGVTSENIDAIRDVAISIEKEDMHSAFLLMQAASALRPGGELLKKKLSEYRALT